MEALGMNLTFYLLFLVWDLYNEHTFIIRKKKYIFENNTPFLILKENWCNWTWSQLLSQFVPENMLDRKEKHNSKLNQDHNWKVEFDLAILTTTEFMNSAVVFNCKSVFECHLDTPERCILNIFYIYILYIHWVKD